MLIDVKNIEHELFKEKTGLPFYGNFLGYFQTYDFFYEDLPQFTFNKKNIDNLSTIYLTQINNNIYCNLYRDFDTKNIFSVIFKIKDENSIELISCHYDTNIFYKDFQFSHEKNDILIFKLLSFFQNHKKEINFENINENNIQELKKINLANLIK